MTIFIVSSADDTPIGSLETAINKEIAEADRIKLNSLSWLISFPGSALELKAKLGIKTNALSGFISSAPDISGVGPMNLAQWIKEKQTGAQ